MAGKLSIRRVGTLLPTLSLAGLLLAIGIILWLCTVGLPDCALRYMEQEAARNGVNLSIGRIRLAPKSGFSFKIEKVRIHQEQPGAAPIELSLPKTQVTFSIIRLLSGEFRPEDLRITRGELRFPLSNTPGDELKLEKVSFYTAFFRNTGGLSSNLTASLGNVDLQIKLGTTQSLQELLPTGTDTTADSSSSLEDTLVSLRPTLQEVKQQLDKQQWTEENHPVLTVSLYTAHKWKAQLKASIPSYEIGNFHFRDATLDASIDDDDFTISDLRFRTIAPDTRVKLQGGYSWETRELEFNTLSTAPIVQMLRDYLGEDAPHVLQQLTSDDSHTPSIELTGNISFSENFAFNNISVRGRIEQKHLHLGSVPVSAAHLSFFMHNGQFSIDTLKLTTPDGHIMAEAFTADEAGYANLDISLPDETLLVLAREISGDSTLALPEELNFGSNLQVRAKVNLRLPDFEPGKSRLNDLVPVLQSCDIQFNCDNIGIAGNHLTNNALTLHIHGIDYNSEELRAEEITLDARIGSARLSDNQGNGEEALLNLRLEKLRWNQQTEEFALNQADLSASTSNARWNDARMNKFQANAGIANIRGKSSDIAGTLQSDAFSIKLNGDTLAYGENEAEGIYLNAGVPEGLNLADAWRNMQRKAHLRAEVMKLRATRGFQAENLLLNVKNEAENQAGLSFSCNNLKDYGLNASITLLEEGKIKVDLHKCDILTASLAPLLNSYMPKELKMPASISARGHAMFDTGTGRLETCQYNLDLRQLYRVCHNVYVHKGMEIPLDMQLEGHFTTAADGSMHYDADVKARHKLGELDVHVSGDPMKNCHITGRNTIPVNIINALIDNEDAHWIMRDFRCQDGITRTNVTNINTTIRYDKGVYVHALCDAELINMDFLLGAIRDVEDPQGNPTGEEYLRTDLGKDPYSRVKHGTCGVDVLVQLDCVDAAGKPLADRIDINLLNPDVEYDNRPWLKRMGIKDGTLTSRITGEAVRFDIEHYTISLHKLKGRCYPAYSIGMYYAPIQHFMEDIQLTKPADIATEYCIFPLSRKCKASMKGLIHAQAASGAGFRFLGTTIPFTDFSGFINISDVDVYLDRMNARCWGGRLDGSLRINFSGEHTTLDGYFVANNLNLKDIVASYGETFTPANCSGFIRFQAAEPTLESIRGYGQVHLTDGDLLQIGLFRPIGAFLADVPGNLTKLQESVHLKKEDAQPSWVDKFIRSIFSTGSDVVDAMQTSAYKVPFANHFLRYGIDEAFARFDLTNGHLITRDMKARGYNLDVDVKLDINLDTLTLNGDLWPTISSVPTLIISPITILSGFLIDIEVYGDLIAPQWKFGLSKKLKGTADSLSTEPQKSAPLKTE